MQEEPQKSVQLGIERVSRGEGQLGNKPQVPKANKINTNQNRTQNTFRDLKKTKLKTNQSETKILLKQIPWKQKDTQSIQIHILKTAGQNIARRSELQGKAHWFPFPFPLWRWSLLHSPGCTLCVDQAAWLCLPSAGEAVPDGRPQSPVLIPGAKPVDSFSEKWIVPGPPHWAPRTVDERNWSLPKGMKKMVYSGSKYEWPVAWEHRLRSPQTVFQ